MSTAPQPEKHKGPRIARPFEISPAEVAYNQLATPPCRLHAPCRFRACEYRPSLQRAIAPAGLLSSAEPEPETTAEREFARAVALAEARGGAEVPGALTGSPVTLDVASAPFAPPCPEQVPRPVEFEEVPSAQSVVTWAPGVRRATAEAAFTSLLTTFFWCVMAFLFTPPWPEHAPRPDETDLVPSMQIVAAACACNDPV